MDNNEIKTEPSFNWDMCEGTSDFNDNEIGETITDTQFNYGK